MLQYIINSSIIWLACLLLYEVWLRRESFHQFNRIYLLTSLLTGLLLPAVNLDRWTPANNETLFLPAVHVYQMKKVMLVHQASEISTPAMSAGPAMDSVLWVIYFIGVLGGLIFMGWEVFALFRLYINGKKSKESGCMIVETGREHSPFSFSNSVFIRSREDFNDAQWVLLLAHEKEHGRQRHFIDNLLLIVLRIIFWFNPLCHLYYKRLRIVHEYQADQIAATSIAVYGTFLLEQNLLQRAPMLTHSFNYSPIKNRIAMLTRTKSARSKLLKYLAVFPLLLILIIFCTQTSFSGEISKKENKVKFKQNEIEFGEFKVVPFEHQEAMQQQKKMFLNVYIPDSFPVIDRANGELLRMEPTISDRMPIAMNGKPIYGNERQYLLSGADNKFIAPVLNKEGKSFDEYLFAKLKLDLDKLEDGVYRFRLDRLVIDEKGQVAYYDHPSIELSMGQDEKKPVIADDVRKEIELKMVNVLDGAMRFKPALKDEKPVNARLAMGNYLIVLKQHKARIVEGGGC